MLKMAVRMLVVVMAVAAVGIAHAQVINVLLLTKQSGSEHEVVTRDNDELSIVERGAQSLAASYGARVNATKDASYITAENLENYDVVVFYTSGNLFTQGSDGHPPMTEAGLQALGDWVEAGGGFVGLHSATDTFRGQWQAQEYLQALGAEFAWHGPSFEGVLRIVDRPHFAVASIPREWEVYDEWYVFENINRDNIRVLAVLDPPEEVREEHPRYDTPELPIIWVRSYGNGRIYYNAMGHEPALFEDRTFQMALVDAVAWASGEGPARTTPNYYEVIELEEDDDES